MYDKNMATPLQTELALPTYAGLTDAAAAAALNAPIVIGTRPATLGDVKLVLYQDAVPSAMLRIAEAAQMLDTTIAGVQMAARQANAYLNDPHLQSLDFANSTVKAGLALLVQGSVLSQALVNQVTALGQVTTTRAKQIGYMQGVTEAAVNMARGGMAT